MAEAPTPPPRDQHVGDVNAVPVGSSEGKDADTKCRRFSATHGQGVGNAGAARHVVIWGRRPDHRGRLRSHLTRPDLARLQALLSGY